MSRYWVSWWSGNCADEGCTKPPFQTWVSGSRERRNGETGDELSMCAVIDAESEDAIWEAIVTYYPDCEQRFCESREADWAPGDRFLGVGPNLPRTLTKENDVAWNPSPEVAVARDAARKLNADECVILCVNYAEETINCITYGKTKALCDRATAHGKPCYDAFRKVLMED